MPNKVSCVLFAWELGANYGHLARDLPVAENLRAAGHNVIFAVRDTRVAAELLGPRGFVFMQAPVSLYPSEGIQAPASYAEILLAEGWGDRISLFGRTKAWLNLVSLVRPDVIVADHAPMALLIAKIANIPVIALGSGFEIPPAVSPLPSIRLWDAVSSARLEHSEIQVLGRLNTVITVLGGKPLMRLTDLFPSNPVFATFAELDHYGKRAGANYIGSIHGLKAANPICWPEGDGVRILAYLRPNQRTTGITLTALIESGFRTICAVPDANKEFIRKYSSASLTIHPGPVASGQLLLPDTVAINYGGHGTIAMALTAGIPQLLIPQTVEQLLVAKKVEALGAGIVVEREMSKNSILLALNKLITDPVYRNAAMHFADKYRTCTPERAVNLATEAILAACGICDEKQPCITTALLN